MAEPAPHDHPPAVDTAAIRERHRACTPDQHVFGAGATVCDAPTLLAELDRLRADYAATVERADHKSVLAAENLYRANTAEAEAAALRRQLDAANKSWHTALEQRDNAHADAVRLDDALAAVMALCDHQDGIGAYMVMVEKVRAATRPAAEPTAECDGLADPADCGCVPCQAEADAEQRLIDQRRAAGSATEGGDSG